MNIQSKIIELDSTWKSIVKNSPSVSIDLVHVIQGNIDSLLVNAHHFEQTYNRTINLFDTKAEQDLPSEESTVRIISEFKLLGTYCSSFFLFVRALSDNLYRLYLELKEPGSKWGPFTSMNKGLKNENFRQILTNPEIYEEWFQGMRELRNCMKVGAFTSGGGFDPLKKEISLSLLVVEKDDKRVATYQRKIKADDLESALSNCITTLSDISK